MELKSQQHNGISWKFSVLGEQALILEPQVQKDHLYHIQSLANQIEAHEVEGIVDIVPAYKSLSIIFEMPIKSHKFLIDILSGLKGTSISVSSKVIHEIPICYDLGLDWEIVENQSGIKKGEFILQHSSKTYTVAMMGFLPGFMFLNGLDDKLSVPRKISPRTKVPSGSVGIGGDQTGIYSLESPGGWNIIGQTPLTFFNVDKTPPTKLKAGDEIKFKLITKKEFEHWSIEF
tara:strand:- start:30672 stop:31367 length:696 start_codon:yes stop_codon:yes gene_type:complete